MKKALLLTLSIALFGFDSKPVSIETLAKRNMTQISCGYYCSKYEVSNGEWKEYTQTLGEKSGVESEIYRNAQPDFAVWQTSLTYGEPISESYFQHPAFTNYPVVGITYAQVQDFLKWKTQQTNQTLQENHANQKVEFRLPTQEEWEEMANFTQKPTLETKWKHFRSKNKTPFNFKTVFGAKINQDGYNITAPVNGLVPNDLDIYNMRGNVAEMIDKQGIAKGGSWVHTEVQSPISQNFEYADKAAWLGFRYVMIVKPLAK